MRVSRSLTIKQMATVFSVALVFIAVFIVILLFHFAQQNRYTVATQMESIARSVRTPLSAAILKADIPQAESILQQIQPSGIVGRADVVLPNQFQALRVSFVNEHPVPVLMARLFELPVQISLPLYSLERPANPQPLAYLVLQADAWRMYRHIVSVISTLVTTWLMLVLVVTVAVTWCINRLMVHPLRNIALELHDLDRAMVPGHQLKIATLHRDDEIGLLVRSYNRNQQQIKRLLEEKEKLATHYPVSELPNKALLLALLGESIRGGHAPALLVVSSETLQEAVGVLKESQRESLLLTLIARMKECLAEDMALAQLNQYDFAIICPRQYDPWAAMTLAQHILAALHEKLPLQSIHLRPTASIGIAMGAESMGAEQQYRRAMSAAQSARRFGRNHVQFFDPEQLQRAQQRLTQESDILNALETEQYAIWLQPQVDIQTGHALSAEVLLREHQPDGSWTLPEGLLEQIESCGLMVTVGNWILESSVRLLASWQQRGIMLPLSVNLSALQLVNPDLIVQLGDLLHRYHIQPGTLILEVTESRRIDDPQAAINILRPLRDKGVRIALDDFGMGYASLYQFHHIKATPVDILKIDKAFVDLLLDDNNVASLIMGAANRLNLDVIAEGVENESQRLWLQEAGVKVVQGFLFAKPMPPEAFSAQYLHGLDSNA
ncbi:biofilm formation regulator HmsP [Shimwellia pseudoproteus]|uniref:biofilm formation regulator HmsP n=1 Tax=Shimwellia pseudoproteus TaxID=570012 RepID=UPI0018EABBE8|nr:biofilm formation regulator HmsP [Shimwellia pseudoproteus]MBJ3814271.1 biofilm formation regulator HmsP [Shimwellia pseudoproteus]